MNFDSLLVLIAASVILKSITISSCTFHGDIGFTS